MHPHRVLNINNKKYAALLEKRESATCKVKAMLLFVYLAETFIQGDLQRLGGGSRDKQPSPTALPILTCYRCHEVGHIARYCLATMEFDVALRFLTAEAESELQRATMDATRTTRQLEETIDEFEKQKIRDIKKIFGEFVTVEMTFHAKALEVYTTAFQNIQNVDEEEDLEVFRSTLRPPDYQSRLQIVRANSKSSLDRTGSTKNMSGTLQQRTPNTLRKKEEEEEEGEEEEEDDDELEDVTEDEN
ncbi:UNVERIFIED_CONTAM: hypothetical protein FKN15_042663 [Acipenser sinensis]